MDLYDPSWSAALTSLRDALQPRITAIVDEFYAGLSAQTSPGALLAILSDQERNNLRNALGRHLNCLASPDLDAATHQRLARAAGMVHAQVGLSPRDAVHSNDLLLSLVRRNLDVERHYGGLSVLARRLIRDLGWQMDAYQELQVQRQEVLAELTSRLSEAASYTDLVDCLISVLGRHEEFTACWVGRPDSSGRFRIEAVGGGPTEAYLAEIERAGATPSVVDGDPGSQGPLGRAWTSGAVERCQDFATDPRMGSWREAALRQGIRSSVAVPLWLPGSPPSAALTLYSRLPGGFASPDQDLFINQLRNLVVVTRIRLESRAGFSDAVSYQLRRHHSHLLHNGGLEMHYQPLLDLGSGRVNKVEALARLRDGSRLLAPQDFLAGLTAEDFLDLFAIGLRQALGDRQRWLEAGQALSLSVNIPSSALSDIRYYNAARQILKEQGCDPAILTLEILETEEAPSGPDTNLMLGRFKTLGIQLAEDDLGSGHSSLSRLREMPFDLVKIDRSIVRLAERDAANVLRFIYQLTRLGHSLGKTVVVEGVENEDLLEAISVLGADAAQGYVIAAPMPGRELTAWLAGNAARRMPNVRQPASVLGKQAKLLVWEERLDVLSRDTPGSATLLAALTHPHLGVGGIGPDGVEPLLSGKAQWLADMEPGLPFGSVDPAVQQALLEAAIRHGPRSAEYSLARRQLLVALLSAAG